MGSTNLPAAELCPLQKNAETNAIEASARHFSARADGHARLSGAVQVKYGDNRVRAEQLRYDSETRRLQASGNVRYTSCAAGNPTWFLSADRFTLDHERGVGTVKDAWLVIGNTPLLYLPRYRVSLENGRSSGFLSPHTGTGSNTGVELGLPYYFNLAPNRDAALEPRLLSKRGVQFNGRYRYLGRYSRGTLEGDWLDDRDHESNKRYSYSLHHYTRAGDKLRMALQLQRVSDTDYIKDLGKSFELNSENYLNSQVLADYVWRGWHLNFTAENSQRTDRNTERRGDLYERQPSVALSKEWRAPRLNLDVGVRGEWVGFNRKYSSPLLGDNPEGERLDSEIVLRRPYRRPGFHFTPSAGMRYTDYRLDDRPDQSRTLPWFSLRTGLAFEKDVARQRYRHTLEPELFYLHVPRRNQGDFPVFDTGVSEFRFSQLFEHNRYNGADRVGDADQLTLALSSRLVHSRSGREAMRLSVGHRTYFRNRAVVLPGEDTTTNRYDYSDLASEFTLNLNEKMKFGAALTWNTKEEQPDRYATRLTLNAGNNRIINLAHRYRRGDQGFDQGEINLHLPIGARWSWFGGWRYDLRASEDIGVMAGFGYDSCCWSLRLMGQRLLQGVDGDDTSIAGGALDYNTRIGIEFNLRGLTGFGTGAGDRLLEKWITDYRG